ncbi:MAG TPA: TonB-dependent receptor [Polyangiaceae bacterium]|nr:TonB-dependent receptor [Polyangiaceae bacterium]
MVVEQPPAAWPNDEPGPRDVIVPVVLVVAPSGKVESVEVEASLGADFDDAARAAASRWAFRPALLDGRTVTAKLRAIVRFVGQPPRESSEVRRRTVVAQSATEAAKAQEPARGTASPKPSDASYSITVTGTRAPPPPRSASEITQDRSVLGAAPHRTASDLLLTVPGLALTQHSGEGAAHQIFFRGFDAVHGRDVEIWAGGAPVNDVSNVHGQGYADLNFLPPEVVERVRFAPGTYDPRQGDFSVAGSLWLDLGYGEPGVTASASLGQFGGRRYFLGYHPTGAPDATFAAFEFYSTNGFGPSRAARRTSAVGQTEFSLGAASLRVMASTYSASFESAGVLRLSDIESGRVDRLGSYDQHQGGDSARSQLVFDVSQADEKQSWSLAPYAVLRSMRLRQDFTGYLVEPFTGSAAEVAAASKATQQGNSEQQVNDAATFGFTASYRRLLELFAPSDSFEAGILARHDLISQAQKKLSIETAEVTLDELGAKIHATNAAGYVDLALHPWSRLTLRGGLRIDGLAYVTQEDGAKGQGQRRAAQGAHLGKKTTVDFRIVPALHALASYGDGFRSPQARSLQEGENAPFTTVQSFELGLRHQSRELRATLSVFRTFLSDDLAFDQVTARNERTPPTRRTGASLEMAAKPTAWFNAAASVTYTRAEFTNTEGGYAAGDLLPYAPELVIRADLAFTPTLGHVLDRPITAHIGLGQTGIARRPLPYGEMGHNTSLLDLLAKVRVRELELGVAAYNVLDLEWYDGEYIFASNFQRGATPSLLPERHVTVGPPRTVFATISLFL